MISWREDLRSIWIQEYLLLFLLVPAPGAPGAVSTSGNGGQGNMVPLASTTGGGSSGLNPSPRPSISQQNQNQRQASDCSSSQHTVSFWPRPLKVINITCCIVAATKWDFRYLLTRHLEFPLMQLLYWDFSNFWLRTSWWMNRRKQRKGIKIMS